VQEKGSTVAYFGDEHDTTGIHYGYCTVSVPAAVHQEGALERPPWYRKENLAYDFTLRRLIPLDAQQMKDRIAQLASRSAENDAFVFIHGYNVAFNDAVMRTAQIAYDFGFRGAPMLFSWPSSGALQNYPRDGESVNLAVNALYRFFDDIVLKAGTKKVHLLAHSMGNRLLLRTLQKFSDEGRGALFGEIIFAAPDVPQVEFSSVGPGKIAALGQRVTLYASSKDNALMASAKFNDRPRLGESGAKLFLADGIDSIDASEVDTDMLHHSYFANAKPVMLDLARLLVKGVGPNADPRNLKAGLRDGLRFWLVGK
jgi:esterase/lipase superfamily enzyme